MLKRVIQLILGITILYFGVAVCLKMNIGVGPADALFMTLSIIFDVEVGYISIVCSLLFLFITFIILGKDFKKKEFFQIFLILFAGVILNFFLYNIFKNFNVNNYFLRILLFIITISIKAFGVLVIMKSDIIKTSIEGCAEAIAFKLNKKMGTIRQMFDVIFILLVLSLYLISKDISMLGIGTILEILLFGPILNVLNKIMKKFDN